MDVKFIRKKRIKDKIFRRILLGLTLFSIMMLIVLIFTIIKDSVGYLDWQFIVSLPSRFPKKAGIYTALWGSVWVIGLTACFSVPIGVGTAIYLEEYAENEHWLTRFIQLNISNLAGVPSIVYGMLGLTIFVRVLGFGRSLLAGSLTLSLLILPIIIVSSREALRAVPNSLREASYALGMTKWKTVTGAVLPFALPSILTGIILAVSRALGEAAPLIMVGAAGYIAYAPRSAMDAFTVLPIQIFNWTSRPQAEFHAIAAAGILVLLIFLLTANGIAIILRNKYQKTVE